MSMSLDVEVDNTSVRNQSHVCMPLNSLLITAGQLCQLHRYGVGANVHRLHRQPETNQGKNK